MAQNFSNELIQLFKKSWHATKITFQVMKKDRRILFFYLISATSSIFWAFSLLFPIGYRLYDGRLNFSTFGGNEWGLLLGSYLGVVFIATFFNVCVADTLKTRSEKSMHTIWASFFFALKRMHLIAYWAFTIVAILPVVRFTDFLSTRFEFLGKRIREWSSSVFGTFWSASSIFVIPSMVYRDLKPIPAIRASTESIHQTWGIKVQKKYGMECIQFLFLFIGIVLRALLLIILTPMGLIGIFIAVGLTLIYLFSVYIIFEMISIVFNTSLYIYAQGGHIPSGFTIELLTNAFILPSELDHIQTSLTTPKP